MTVQTPAPTLTPMSKKTAMFRGFKGRCPNCNKAPLFRAYLKQVDICENCGQDWGHIRADDGPAWSTMLIVGHLLAPFLHFVIFNKSLADWAPLVIFGVAALILCLALLPRMKGLFIGLIWITKAPTS